MRIVTNGAKTEIGSPYINHPIALMDVLANSDATSGRRARHRNRDLSNSEARGAGAGTRASCRHLTSEHMSALTLGRDILGRIARVAEHEWLVTNGIGGFASSTVSLMNTRRYHGLLFASLRPPVERMAMVSKVDVTAIYGGTHVPLATNEFADGTISPQGFCHLESFRLEGLIPVWTWLIGDANLQQRIWMHHGENTT